MDPTTNDSQSISALHAINTFQAMSKLRLLLICDPMENNQDQSVC